MATEPVTVFGSCVDPESVVRVVRLHAPLAQVTRDGGTWRAIEVRFGRGLLRRDLKLRLAHDPDYYGGAGWPQQHAGVIGYFSRAPIEGQRREQVLATVRSFRFAVASVAEPELLPDGDDPRLELLGAIARKLDGCLFVPSGLRDPCWRALISMDGSFDADSVFPQPDTPEAPPGEDDPDDDADEEPEPPTAERVARRLMVLAAVAGRGVLEMQHRKGEPGAAVNLPRIRAWLETLGLQGECEPEEWLRIGAAVGTLPEQEMLDSTWRLEGLGVLAWSLGLYELPRYDTLVDVGELLAAVGFLQDDRARSILATPWPRSVEDLAEMAETLLAFHWRMRDFSLRPKSLDFADFGRSCWFGPIEVGWAEIVEGDLALEGIPISAASTEVIGRCRSCAMERHLAINWLRGWSEVYSETDTST